MLNLYADGSATNKSGFIVKYEQDKVDSRPLDQQLSLDSNPILNADNLLKQNLKKPASNGRNIYKAPGVKVKL